MAKLTITIRDIPDELAKMLYKHLIDSDVLFNDFPGATFDGHVNDAGVFASNVTRRMLEDKADVTLNING